MGAKQKEIDALKRQGKLVSEQQKRDETIVYKDAEMDDLRKRYENETDSIKKAELARQMEAKQKEIDALKRDANKNNQKIIEEKIIYKDSEMDNLRRQYENETDPIKKAELARQLEAKQKEIDALKRQGKLVSDQEKRDETIVYKDAEM